MKKNTYCSKIILYNGYVIIIKYYFEFTVRIVIDLASNSTINMDNYIISAFVCVFLVLYLFFLRVGVLLVPLGNPFLIIPVLIIPVLIPVLLRVDELFCAICINFSLFFII